MFSIQSTKSETNHKFKSQKNKTFTVRFFDIRILNLFRISDFAFRI